MKNILKSYASFTRSERMGIIALMLLMIVLIAVNTSMHFWVSTPTVDIQQITTNKAITSKTAKTNKSAKINLNNADSLSLIALPGIGKGLSHRILERRRQLGSFTNMQQVLDVYKFKQETKQMLQERTYIN